MIANGLVRGALPALGQQKTPATIPHSHRRGKEFRHRSVCAAGQPAGPQVSQPIGLSGSDREFPVLTGRSGTQRARRIGRVRRLATRRPGPRHHPVSYALRGCHGALLAGSKPALASCSQGAAGGERWLLIAVRGHLRGTRPKCVGLLPCAVGRCCCCHLCCHPCCASTFWPPSPSGRGPGARPLSPSDTIFCHTDRAKSRVDRKCRRPNRLGDLTSPGKGFAPAVRVENGPHIPGQTLIIHVKDLSA